MHILILSHVWEPENGTPQRRWSWLTKQLREAGHDVSVITPPPHYPHGTVFSDAAHYQRGSIHTGTHGETIHRSAYHPHDQSLLSRIHSETRIMISQMRIARRLIHHHKPDVIIATAPPLPTVFTGTYAARLNGTPLIVDLRDAWPDILNDLDSWEHLGQSLRPCHVKKALTHYTLTLGGRLFNACLKRSHAIITTTQSYEKILQQRGHKHTLTLRNLATLNQDLTPTSLTTHHPELRILYAGNIGRAQGLLNALEAIKILHSQKIPIRMRIVGTGVEKDTLLAYTRTHNLPVEFINHSKHSDIPQHYAWADTIVIHLRQWEALNYTVPSKLYEALHTGRHITFVGQGEAAHIITESHAGSICPPSNPQALANLWRTLHTQRELLNVGSAGKNWLTTLGTPEENGKKFVNFVEDIAHAHS